MTQEEKAKTYDEVVNKLKHFILQGVNQLITRFDVQYFFPELAESEDEKTRKKLMGFIYTTCFPVKELKKKEKFLDWLEKQGTSYTKRDVEDAYVEGMAFAKNELEKQREQKSAWSEEDELMLECVLDKIGDLGTGVMCKEWLKSLKQRHTWRPSKEQMEALEHFIIHHNGSTNYAKDLEEIRIQLKKLKGE